MPDGMINSENFVNPEAPGTQFIKSKRSRKYGDQQQPYIRHPWFMSQQGDFIFHLFGRRKKSHLACLFVFTIPCARPRIAPRFFLFASRKKTCTNRMGAPKI